MREELVYVRGKVDSKKSDLVLLMQVLIMSTLTFHLSGNLHTGVVDESNFLAETEQSSSRHLNDIYGVMDETNFFVETKQSSPWHSNDIYDAMGETNFHAEIEQSSSRHLNDIYGAKDKTNFLAETEQYSSQHSNDIYGAMDKTNFLAETEQSSFRHSNDIYGAMDKTHFLVETEQSSSQHSNDIYGAMDETNFLVKIEQSSSRHSNDTYGAMDKTNFLAETEQSSSHHSNDIYDFKILGKKIQPTATEFTREELLSATNNFGEVLGKGGFGTVFIGTLYDGKKVAVKKFMGGTKEGKEGWANELAVMIKIDHPNILNLMGYCSKDDLMLVYEYMAKGNLSDFILGGESKQIMDWPARLRIILDVIRGLAYLHEGTAKCIAHRDIKPSNILLDENFNAKISDFGISIMLPNETQYVDEDRTLIRGTIGYIAPEFLQFGRLTEKADIYSFGMLLLNVVSGKRAVDRTAKRLELLSEHAWRLHRDDRLNELIDPRLRNGNGFNSTSILRTSDDFNLSSILRTFSIALWCIQRDPAVRPSASRVLAMLSSGDEIPPPPLPVEMLSSGDEIPRPPVESLFNDDHSSCSSTESIHSSCSSTTFLQAEEDDYLWACDEAVGETEERTLQF